MDLVHLFFVTSLILAGGYFLLKPSLDGFTYAYLSILFYFSPAILPYGFGINGRYSIPPIITLFGGFVLWSVIIADRVFPRIVVEFDFPYRESGIKSRSILETLVPFVFGVTFCLFVLLLVPYQFQSFGGSKAALATYPFVDSLFRVTATFGLVMAVLVRQRLQIAVYLSMLAVHLLLYQVRSTIAFALAATLLIYFRRANLSLSERVQYGLSGGMVAMFFLLFDQVKRHLFFGNFGVLFHMKPYRGIFFNNNAQVYIEIFSLTLEHQVAIESPIRYLGKNILGILPFGQSLFGIRPVQYGNDIIAPQFFPTRTGGIVGNIWAEAFALAGFEGVVVALFIYLAGLAFLSAQLDSDTPAVRTLAYSILPYWAVYYNVLPTSEMLGSYYVNYALVFGGLVVLSWVIHFLIFTNRSKEQRQPKR